MSHKQRISLCVIAKNEEAVIGRCLASAKAFVDEIIVVDTGSTDGTVKIAHSYGATVGHFAWCGDFAAARNAALDLATGAWILSLDCDEVIDSATGFNLRKLVKKAPAFPAAYDLRIRSAHDDDGTIKWQEGWVCRLFEHHPQIRWQEAIHEQIVWTPTPDEGMHHARSADVVIVHDGYLREVAEAKGKNQRNLAIMLRLVDEHPENPKYWRHLAQEYVSQGLYQSAVKPIDTCLILARAQGKLGHMWLGEVYKWAVIALTQIGQAERAIKIGEEGVKLHPNYPDLWHNLGTVYVATGQPADGIRCFERAIALHHAEHDYTGDSASSSWRPLLNMGIAYMQLLEPVRAWESFDAARRFVPDYPPVFLGIGQALAALGETDAALECMHNTVQRWPESDEAREILKRLEEERHA